MEELDGLTFATREDACRAEEQARLEYYERLRAFMEDLGKAFKAQFEGIGPPTR